jgi:Tfp pilus assembly protein PilF
MAGLLLVTALLGGCATGNKTKVVQMEAAPALAAQPAPPQPTGPSVVHFTDGREGFLITEPGGDAQVRADFERASGLIREGKHDAAIELMEKVIAQSPGNTAPRINIAIAYRQVNKPEKAEEHLKKALELVPGHPVASNEYGLLLRKAGRFAESRLIYENSVSGFPEYLPVRRNLGILCDLYLKDLACAAEQYEVYGKAMPKDQHVKMWLADLQTRRLTASAGMAGGSPIH